MHAWPVKQKKHANSFLVEEGQFKKQIVFSRAIQVSLGILLTNFTYIPSFKILNPQTSNLVSYFSCLGGISNTA